MIVAVLILGVMAVALFIPFTFLVMNAGFPLVVAIVLYLVLIYLGFKLIGWRVLQRAPVSQPHPPAPPSA